MENLSASERDPYEAPTLVKRDRLSMITAQTLCTRTQTTNCSEPDAEEPGAEEPGVIPET